MEGALSLLCIREMSKKKKGKAGEMKRNWAVRMGQARRERTEEG